MPLVLAPGVSHRYWFERKDVCSAVMTSSNTCFYHPKGALNFMSAIGNCIPNCRAVPTSLKCSHRMGAEQNLRKVPRLTYRMTVFTARSIPMDSTFNVKREFFLTPLHERYFISIRQEEIYEYNAASCANIYAVMCLRMLNKNKG